VSSCNCSGTWEMTQKIKTQALEILFKHGNINLMLCYQSKI